MKLNPLLVHRIKTLSASKIRRKFVEWLILGGYILMCPVVLLAIVLYSKHKKVHYKFGTLNFSSIGHALNVDAFARRTQYQDDTIKYVFVPTYQKIINPYFYELIKRKFLIVENPILRFFLIAVVRVPNKLRFDELLTYLNADEISRYPKVNWFSDEDVRRGNELLVSLGLELDSWYVCFFARDNAYNENYNSGDELDYNLRYHSSRNSDIATYEKAMKYVIEQGGAVIRMGMVMTKEVSFKHSHLIDYPFQSQKSDFADVFLMCHAKFVIGCVSGLVDLSSIVDMPLGCVNSSMPWLGHQRKNVAFIPKLIQSKITGKFISLKEHSRIFADADNIIVYMGVMSENSFVHVNNTEDEILLITRKMYENFVLSNAGILNEMGKDNLILEEFLDLHPELSG